MDAELEKKLHKAYPDGYLAHLNVEACDFYNANCVANLLGKRLRSARQATDQFGWCINERVGTPTFSLTVDDGSFGNDVDGADGSLYQWLKNAGETELVLAVMVSTLYPVWRVYHYLRAPHLSGSGSADTELAQFPPAPLETCLATIASSCTELGLKQLTPAELAEPVPFVTDCVWASEEEFELLDDPDADFTPAPTQRACTVGDCLFKQY